MTTHRCECGSELKALVFGLPDSRDLDGGFLDDVVLGGCMVRGGGADPNLACPDCDRRYVRVRRRLLSEEAWLAPLSVGKGDDGGLRVTLNDMAGKTVTLQVGREAYEHFAGFLAPAAAT